MRVIHLVIVAGVVLVTTSAADAQSGPSAQQIIQALKPTGTVSSTTRGIVPLPAGPGAIASHQPAIKGLPRAMPEGRISRNGTAPSINLNIDFALGSATLTPRAKTELDRLGHALTDPALASYHFKLVGHTDTTGSAATNLALSNARAQAVGAYLQSKFAIAPTRLTTKGVGEQDLLVPTGPDTPDQANRRVQVINTGK